MSEILRLSSALWSLLHILVLFMFFYVPGYSRKKGLIITYSVMVPLVLSSFVFFFFMAKHRDFRFLFTFCLVETMSALPTNIIYRSEDMPVMLIFLVIMPIMYLNIFQILSYQNKLYTAAREQELMRIQSSYMQVRLQTIDVMLQKEAYEDVRGYIKSAQQTLETPPGERFCKNAILDAVCSFYFKLAAEKEIRVGHSLNIPEELPVKAEELSIVLANTLENAIHACEKLPADKRVVKCRCIDHPQFMLQISNPRDRRNTTKARVP